MNLTILTLYALVLVCSGNCTGQAEIDLHKELKTFKSLIACQKDADAYNARSFEFTTEDGKTLFRSDVNVHAHCVPLSTANTAPAISK